MLVLVFLIFCVFPSLQEFVIDHEVIDRINSDPSFSWKAGVNSMFVGKTLEDVKKYLIPIEFLKKEKYKDSGRLVKKRLLNVKTPDAFDTYTHWPHCKKPIWNQGNCGSCWAVSAASSVTDAFCTQGLNLTLSPQCLVSCESDEYACQGGYLSREWDYLENTGIVTDSCFPYVSGEGQVPKCPNKCVDPKSSWDKKYKVKSFTHFNIDTVDAIAHMMQYGSIQAAFTVYKDFFSYKSGVYDCEGSMEVGGHAVKIQGFGVDSASGKKYWNVANSWGKSWGDLDGYFWITRGSDRCSIEDQLYGGIPDL